jgi:hypothetical protein
MVDQFEEITATHVRKSIYYHDLQQYIDFHKQIVHIYAIRVTNRTYSCHQSPWECSSSWSMLAALGDAT